MKDNSKINRGVISLGCTVNILLTIILSLVIYAALLHHFFK